MNGAGIKSSQIKYIMEKHKGENSLIKYIMEGAGKGFLNKKDIIFVS